MTNFGKCETCRARKVKCDEALPKCGACRKKGRECRYTNARDSIFVHEQVQPVKQETSAELSSVSTAEISNSVARAARKVTLHMRRSRKATDGVGEFHTLGEIKSGKHPTRSIQYEDAILAVYKRSNDRGLRAQSRSPVPALLCPQTQQAAEWSSIFGFEALQLNPLGSWIQSAWTRRGENACLDFASDYTLESMRAFRQKDQVSVSRAWAKAERALRSLQAAMQSKKTNQECLIFAVMLHCAAEQFVDVSSFYYVPHVYGIAELLKSYLENGVCKEPIRNVVSLICFDEINLSITFTRPSALESVPIPYTPIDGPYELGLALLANDYVLVQIPRLVSLVRSAWEQPEDDQLRSEASRRVKEWYKTAPSAYIEKTLESHMWTVEWAGDPARSPNGQCFEFDSLIAFAIATRHFASRILTCGLMQTVESLEGGSPNSGVTEAQQEDITSAISLGMCLSYALRPSESMPITALGLVMPLQVAHSAWYRMKKRHSSTNAEEYQRAVRMKDWNMEGIHALENVWCDKHCNHERMDEYAEMVAGGKAFEYAYNYKRRRADSPEPGTKVGNAGEPEYQWVLDLSAGLNGLAISESQKEVPLQTYSKNEISQNRSKSKKHAIETVAQLDPLESSETSSRTLFTGRASSSAFAQGPADDKALMRAWGYQSNSLEHFRQS